MTHRAAPKKKRRQTLEEAVQEARHLNPYQRFLDVMKQYNLDPEDDQVDRATRAMCATFGDLNDWINEHCEELERESLLEEQLRNMGVDATRKETSYIASRIFLQQNIDKYGVDMKNAQARTALRIMERFLCVEMGKQLNL
jgi:hypothetical protein